MSSANPVRKSKNRKIGDEVLISYDPSNHKYVNIMGDNSDLY